MADSDSASGCGGIRGCDCECCILRILDNASTTSMTLGTNACPGYPHTSSKEHLPYPHHERRRRRPSRGLRIRLRTRTTEVSRKSSTAKRQLQPSLVAETVSRVSPSMHREPADRLPAQSSSRAMDLCFRHVIWYVSSRRSVQRSPFLHRVCTPW